MKKAVQFGAGNIGRGFMGDLFHQSGYHITFVDVDRAVIDAINRTGSYLIDIVGDNPQKKTITDISALDAKDVEEVANAIKDADVLCTAVGANALKFVAPTIAKGVVKRFGKGDAEPLNIIVCENLLHSARILKEMILKDVPEEHKAVADERLGASEAVVSRMVPVVPDAIKEKDPTYILVEEYAKLPVDKHGFVGEIPSITGLLPLDNITAYQERKLFTHNCGHALFGYLGYQKQYEYIWQTVHDKDIYKMVWDGLWESGRALVQKHNFTVQQHTDHINDLIHRFQNKDLGDTVERIARDPIRKLGYNDRLIGSARIALEYDIEPRNILTGIVAALRYDNPVDKVAVRLHNMIENEGIEHVLKNVCGLDDSSELFSMILRRLSE